MIPCFASDSSDISEVTDLHLRKWTRRLPDQRAQDRAPINSFDVREVELLYALGIFRDGTNGIPRGRAHSENGVVAGYVFEWNSGWNDILRVHGQDTRINCIATSQLELQDERIQAPYVLFRGSLCKPLE
jgi:hypothetical protein